MNSTELSIKRGRTKAAFSKMFSSPLYLVYAIASLALIVYMSIFVIGGIFGSPYTYADPNLILPDEAMPLIESEEELMNTITPQELIDYIGVSAEIEIKSDELWDTSPKFKELLVSYKDDIEALVETKGLKYWYTPEEVETYLPDINAAITRKAKSYTFASLSKVQVDLQDTDSVFLVLIMCVPFLIWRVLKLMGNLVLFFSGRKYAKDNTPISNFGISTLVSTNSGEMITIIAVLALAGLYALLGSNSFASMVVNKTEEPVYDAFSAYIPFVLFALGIIVAFLAIMYMKRTYTRIKIALIEKDTPLLASKVTAILCFIAAVLPIIFGILLLPSVNQITADAIANHTRLVSACNMIYDGNGFTTSFIIFVILFAIKFVATGLVQWNTYKTEQSIVH